MQFQAIDPAVEVSGEGILPFVAGLGVFKKKALEILASHGVSNPQPGMWYPLQGYLDSFKEIADWAVGDNTLVSMGLAIPKNAVWPADIENIDQALVSIDVAYHLNHRFGEIGHYSYEKTGERTGGLC